MKKIMDDILGAIILDSTLPKEDQIFDDPFGISDNNEVEESKALSSDLQRIVGKVSWDSKKNKARRIELETQAEKEGYQRGLVVFGKYPRGKRDRNKQLSEEWERFQQDPENKELLELSSHGAKWFFTRGFNQGWSKAKWKLSSLWK